MGIRDVGMDEQTMAGLVAQLTAIKAGRLVSVCIPCRNEVTTIATVVGACRAVLMDGNGFVDELIVVDDGSTDGSAKAAIDAGATVVDMVDVHREHGTGSGKGNVLWASLLTSKGDIVVWCDGDVTNFDPTWVIRLAMPLLLDDTLQLVKGHYHRPTADGGGGRTTELVARPMISLLFPELATIQQPLSGEYAVRRNTVEMLPFVEGWGVEVALLIDALRNTGADSIGQVDLGVREHSHHPLHALAVQAAEVMATILSRAGVAAPADPVLTRADGTVVPLNLAERPPVASLRRGR